MNNLRLKPLTVDSYDNVLCNDQLIGRVFQYGDETTYCCCYEYPADGTWNDADWNSFPTQEECLKWIEKQHLEFLMIFLEEKQ